MAHDDRVSCDGAVIASDPVAFHDGRAAHFADRYNKSAAFRERNTIWSEWIAADVAADQSVADIGCGSGIFSFVASQYARRVVGYDASAAMISLAESGAKDRGFANVDFEIRRVEDLRNIAKQFDVVLCSSVLEYLNDAETAILDIANLLKVGGVFLFSLPNKGSLYRRIEPLLYKVTGRPAYFGLVKFNPFPDVISSVLERAGLRITRQTVFGDPPARLLFRWLPGGTRSFKTMTIYRAVKT